jgi:methylated-DNA-protein-cysteine methyltransferase-like protein
VRKNNGRFGFFWRNAFFQQHFTDLDMAKSKKDQEKPNFFEDVYEVVTLIPKGRVTSYGAIARYLGTGMSARMVGWAMNAVHSIKAVPAHRVVNSQGLLTGMHHFKPPSSMQKSLEKEGVKVSNNKVIDFEKKLWDPGRELL